MKSILYSFGTLLLLLFTSCIGDDIVFDTIPERLTINNPIDSLQLDSSYQFEASFFNNIGDPEQRSIAWTSTDQSIISINSDGLATALTLGEVMINATVTSTNNTLIEDEIRVVVSENETVAPPPPAERNGVIQTTSSYVLEGTFTLNEENGALKLSFESDYRASSSLPGLYVYLTNNPNTINNAFEIGKVPTFSGEHSYTISGPELDEYNYVLYFCKPFGVKVGDGEIQ